ncbi:hypothetical protein [Salinarimonas soli]|uniref:Uncharacterized protein n=1 Tax=Salinarimonas soli TaxID=1638099 RepID=A0A5B2VAC5_9HYPH|nr:hypothetical protein [Salinarimonas soli]KAA2236473.1 hypothetical protein F0L46_15140 [Salinarimonas soli]
MTYRAGIEAAAVTRNELSEANAAFADAVERARRLVERQKVPRRVELLDRGVVIDASDLVLSGAG